MNTHNKIEITKNFADGARRCLKLAFYRRSPQIAENFTILGKSVSERTVRKMTEVQDVRRRNPLEAMCLLLGAAFITSPKRFEIIWQYLLAFVADLRGMQPRFDTMERAFIEFRHRYIFAERVFYDGERDRLPQALSDLDASLRGVYSHLALRP